MKKTLTLLFLGLVALMSAEAQTTNPSISTMYRFTNISAANLAATITTASSETPGNGATLSTLNTFKGPGGTYSITATYR